MKMPMPDAATIDRRATIAADLARILPGDAVIHEARERRVYESDGLTAYRTMPLEDRLLLGMARRRPTMPAR
ncbi:MAG: hypothetical protein WEC00_08415 [Dongiaceae bacterium]